MLIDAMMSLHFQRKCHLSLSAREISFVRMFGNILRCCAVAEMTRSISVVMLFVIRSLRRDIYYNVY